jgi:hypothetical protein
MFVSHCLLHLGTENQRNTTHHGELRRCTRYRNNQQIEIINANRGLVDKLVVGRLTKSTALIISI